MIPHVYVTVRVMILFRYIHISKIKMDITYDMRLNDDKGTTTSSISISLGELHKAGHPCNHI